LQKEQGGIAKGSSQWNEKEVSGRGGKFTPAKQRQGQKTEFKRKRRKDVAEVLAGGKGQPALRGNWQRGEGETLEEGRQSWGRGGVTTQRESEKKKAATSILKGQARGGRGSE